MCGAGVAGNAHWSRAAVTVHAKGRGGREHGGARSHKGSREVGQAQGSVASLVPSDTVVVLVMVVMVARVRLRVIPVVRYVSVTVAATDQAT